MLIVEDLETDAPNTIPSGKVRGAKRFEQVGPDAVLKQLDALFDSQELGRLVVQIIVPSVGVGDEIQAVLTKRQNTCYPLYYTGVSTNALTSEWLRRENLATATHQFSQGLLQIPGQVPTSLEFPAALADEPIAPPKFNLLLPKMHNGE